MTSSRAQRDVAIFLTSASEPGNGFFLIFNGEPGSDRYLCGAGGTSLRLGIILLRFYGAPTIASHDVTLCG